MSARYFCIFHDWSWWVQYHLQIPARRISKNYELSAAREYRQVKRCGKCGKVKDSLIRTELHST